MHNHRSDWHGIGSIYQVASKQADKENLKKLRRKPNPTKALPYTRPEAPQEKQRARRQYPKDAFWTKEAIFNKMKWFRDSPSEQEKFEDEMDRALEDQELIPITSEAVVLGLPRRRSSAPPSSSRKTKLWAGPSTSSSSSSSLSSSPSVYPRLSSSMSSSVSSSESPRDFPLHNTEYDYDGNLNPFSLPPALAHIPTFYPDLHQNLSYTYNYAMQLPWVFGSAHNVVAPPSEFSDALDAVLVGYDNSPANNCSFEEIDPSLRHALEAPLDFQPLQFEDENLEFCDFAPENVEYAPHSMYPQHMSCYYPEPQPAMFEPAYYPGDFLSQPY